jgi:predicted solute-binding protein
MLEGMDAALIIGDPALRVDPVAQSGYVYDLAEEWTKWTGLPMVFAVWAGRRDVITPPVIRAFQDSARYGREHLDEIVAAESISRKFPPDLVRTYLTRHIVTELGAAEEQGMALFLRYAKELAGPQPLTSDTAPSCADRTTSEIPARTAATAPARPGRETA